MKCRINYLEQVRKYISKGCLLKILLRLLSINELSIPNSLTFCRLNKFPHYILEDSNLDFRYITLCDLDIPREKWLNYLQTVETLIRSHILRHLIWVCAVCQLSF